MKLIAHFFNGKFTALNVLEFVARSWLGYILIINSPVGVTIPLESLGLPENGYLLIKAMWETGFLMHIVKAIELIGGVMLLLNLYVPLVLVILMPLLINILGLGYFIFHGVKTSLPMFLIACFLMARSFRTYLPMLKANEART